MNTEERIAAVLAQHQGWTWSIRRQEMGCKGPICDWTRPIGLLDPCGPAFVEHQADMIAAAMPLPEPAPTGHREDLTVFAALIARLGGETTVSWAEAARLQGVTVTRWDEPEHMRYRFTLGAPEFDSPADLGVTDPADPQPTVAELHARRAHPAYEYATTEGQRKAWDDADTPPEGEGWERNTDAGRNGWDRFDYTEESYWRRPKADQ